MGLSTLINLAEQRDIIRFSNCDVEGTPTNANGYQYQNEAIEALYQKTLNYSDSLSTSVSDSSKDDIVTFVKGLFYIEDNDQQSLHSVFKSLSGLLSDNKSEALNSLLKIFILQGDDIDGSLTYSVNLGINSYNRAEIKAIIFNDYFTKLFQVLDLLYSNFTNDKDIESIFYSFPITEVHKCFSGSFERLGKTFYVLNNKSHQSIQSSIAFKEGLLDEKALKFMSAFQRDHDSLMQDYEIHSRTALSALTMTVSIDEIKESGGIFSANLVEEISFDQAIKIFKEYRNEFSLFLSSNLQNLFNDIINKSGELNDNQVRKIIENYETLNSEISLQYKSLLPNFYDFYDLDTHELFEKSTIIDNYQKRVENEIKQFTQLINKIPDSAYKTKGEDNWNVWSRWIDEASIDNKDLLMHIISLTSLNLSRLYIDGENHAQNAFIVKFKDKIFSEEILTKLFTSNESAHFTQLILSYRQQDTNLALLETKTLTAEELLFFDNLQKLDNLATFIDTSHVTEITHEPKNINDFFAVLRLLNSDNIESFTSENENQGCYKMFLYFCKSLSKEELTIILEEISKIDEKIDHHKIKLIEYFANYLFPSSLTLAEKKYLEFIIKNVDESHIKFYRTALSYIENKENYLLLKSYMPNAHPIIEISINDQDNMKEIHTLVYNFSDAFVHELPIIKLHKHHYKLEKDTEDTKNYTLIELAINIQDEKFLDRIIDHIFDQPQNLRDFLAINDDEKISIIKIFETLNVMLDLFHEDDKSEFKAYSFRTYAISQIINKLVNIYYKDDRFKQCFIWQYEGNQISLNPALDKNLASIIDDCYNIGGFDQSIPNNQENARNPLNNDVSNITDDEYETISTDIDASLSLLQIILEKECIGEKVEFDDENASTQDRISYILRSQNTSEDHEKMTEENEEIAADDIKLIKKIYKLDNEVLNKVLLYHIDNQSFKDIKLFSYAVILSNDIETIKSYIDACEEDQFNYFIKSLKEIKKLTDENNYNKVLNIIFESLTSEKVSKDSHEEYQNNQIIGNLIDQEITKQYLNNIIEANDLKALSNFVKKINDYIYEQNYQPYNDCSELEDSECENKECEERNNNKDYNKSFGLNFLSDEDDSIEFPRLGADNSEHFNQLLDDSCLKLLLQKNFDKLFSKDSKDTEKANDFLRNNICDTINYLKDKENKLNKTTPEVAQIIMKTHFDHLPIDELLNNESAKNHHINIGKGLAGISNGDNLLHILASNNKKEELKYISKIATKKEKFDQALLQKNEDGQTPIDILESRSLFDLANELKPQPAAVTLPIQTSKIEIHQAQMSLD